MDRLTDDELAQVAAQIDRLKKSRSSPGLEERQQGNKAQKEKDESQATEAEKAKDESQATQAQKEQDESQATKAQKEKDESQATEAQKADTEEQDAKLARKRKLHARYMRFSRSLTSAWASTTWCVRIYLWSL